MRCLALLCLLLLQTIAHGFHIKKIKDSLRHQDITEQAIFDVTLDTCRAFVKDFKPPSKPYTAESILTACDAAKSSKTFWGAIEIIKLENVGVDLLYFWSARHHFDAEEFTKGKELITLGLSAVIKSNKLKNFLVARIRLGQLLHPLQDFYSHSNWVEMGNRKPTPNLIQKGRSIGKIADKKRKTCENCVGSPCKGNILKVILEEKILTSGYFGLTPLASKPDGKCSHGGDDDTTREIEPTGGINKDTVDSEHGYLHKEAANVAKAATIDVLKTIRAAAGDTNFLLMMGIKKGKALCFVIDTTGSMSNDIATVRELTSNIIDKKVGEEEEPSLYLLVPFNDPDFGPLIKTTDPDEFKAAINALGATGGGDYPEMSLSGLQLALTGAPPGSEIYLFTDATAKDTYLLNDVLALIENTKSSVSFLLTGALARRRRDADNDEQQQQPNFRSTLAKSESIYNQLAKASGGLAIKVSKDQLLEATSIITDSSSSSLVTLLQVSGNPGDYNLTFVVDESAKNLTVFITGAVTSFTVISPSGVAQSSTSTTGPLIISYNTVGNFQTVKLNTQVGQWEIRIVTTNSNDVKVVAESLIDFIFNFMKLSQSPYGGYEVISNRPSSESTTDAIFPDTDWTETATNLMTTHFCRCENGTLRVVLTGSDSSTVTEVFLVESQTSGRVNGRVDPQEQGVFLIHFDEIPAVDFVVLVMGLINNSTKAPVANFQRQSSSTIKASTVTVTASDFSGVVEPGVPISIPFSVATSGIGGIFSIQATDDQGFHLNFLTSLSLSDGGSSNSSVTLTAPAGTPSGIDVTLTIVAADPSASNSNYVVLRLTVLAPATDFTPPECHLLRLSNCSDNCTESMWELSLQVTDGANGSGIASISFRQGDGTLNTTVDPGNNNITLVTYNASCCSPDVEITVVDEADNVEFCFFSVRKPTTTATPTTIPPQTTVSTTMATSTTIPPQTTVSTTMATSTTITPQTTVSTTTPSSTTSDTSATTPQTTSAAMFLLSSPAQFLMLVLSSTILGFI